MLQKNEALRQRAASRPRREKKSPAKFEISFETEKASVQSDVDALGERRSRQRPRRDDLENETQLLMPLSVPVRLDDNYGAARSGGRRHQGLDLLAPRGTPIVAAAGGVVSKLGHHPRGGNCLWVTATDGSTYYYAHLDRFATDLDGGESVEAGDLLGYVGTTGNAAGGPPHLHFEVHRHGEATNPYPLLLRAGKIGAEKGAGSVAAR